MSTCVEAETQDITELDFNPVCEVEEPGWVEQVECAKPAVWVGTAPCGHDFYFCEQHHYDQRRFTCHQCGRRDMHLATYRWVRL